MKARYLPVSSWLLAIGAGAVLFIGVFARFDPASARHSVAAASASPPPRIQDDQPVKASPPDPLSPGMSEIIKLAQAHLDEGVILAYIQNSGRAFSPTADELLYLSGLGASQDVLGALVNSAPPVATPRIAMAPPAAPAPAPAPAMLSPVASQPEPDTAADAFYSAPAPGSWQPSSDYDLVQQPVVETIPPGLSVNYAGPWLPPLSYPLPAHRDESRKITTAAVEHPATPAPRSEVLNPPVHKAPSLPAPPEPAHAASPPTGAAKSGK
jgi:hypothetical protein